MQDRLLLRQFTEHGSQAAFAEIVGRYLRLVYATCLREVGDRQLAEDVTQGVFLILAQKSPSLGGHVPLAGWLFRTARLASKSAIRQEQRRRHWERAAAGESESAWAAAGWRPQEVSLNEALAALKPGEREAVLLRFFEELSFQEVGAALGLSEDTAQKRVSRALEKMRSHLTRSGEALPLTALVGVLSAEAAHSAPSTCAAPLLQIVPGLKIALETSGLFGSRSYHISQGVLRTMKAKSAVTAASISILAVVSVSLLMAGTIRTGNNIVGTWVTTNVEYGTIPQGAKKPEQLTDTTTYRFKSDNTLTCTAVTTNARVHKTYMEIASGRYSVTGKSLTLLFTHTTQGTIGRPRLTALMTFSDTGKVLTLKGQGQTVMQTVLTRQ